MLPALCSTLCDPYLNLFRGIIPPIGGTLDLSPVLAFIVLDVGLSLFLESVCLQRAGAACFCLAAVDHSGMAWRLHPGLSVNSYRDGANLHELLP